MSEFTRNPSPFRLLEQEISAQLLQNDNVYGLIADALRLDAAADPAMQPDFLTRPYYGGSIPEEIPDDEVSKYMPITLQISESGSPRTGLPELTIAFETYKYIEIGWLAKDGSDIRIYDEVGRLHQVKRDENGEFIFSENAPFDLRRAEAVMAWQEAHNAMVRAARQNPAIHVDHYRSIWSDHPHDGDVKFRENTRDHS